MHRILEGIGFDSGLATTTSIFDPGTQNSEVFAYVVGVGGCSDSAFITVNVALPFTLNFV